MHNGHFEFVSNLRSSQSDLEEDFNEDGDGYNDANAN
jgi:hypothetical protein